VACPQQLIHHHCLNLPYKKQEPCKIQGSCFVLRQQASCARLFVPSNINLGFDQHVDSGVGLQALFPNPPTEQALPDLMVQSIYGFG
jgi:hypothetical protein